MQKLKSFVAHPKMSSLFKNFILVVILLNCIFISLQNSPNIMTTCRTVIQKTNMICSYIFAAELILILIVHNKSSCSGSWNRFDFFFIVISFLADFSTLSAFRIFRVFQLLPSFRATKSLKSLKLLSGLKHLRVIVTALANTLPSIAWTVFFPLLVFYNFGLIGSTVFEEHFDAYFGNFGMSLFMAMKSWSIGIVRLVMSAFSHTWIHYITFILMTAYAILNLVVCIIVTTIIKVKIDEK